jgi:agmatinase
LPAGIPPREALARAREEIRRAWTPDRRLVMLGGDHTATLPVVEAMADAYPDLRVVQFDAHPDLREHFLGERYCYASAMARVIDVIGEDRVYQVGMRTGAREEFARRHPRFFPVTEIGPRDAVLRILPEVRRFPLYVTVDIDVLDPSEAPGTGSPEAGGLRVPELIDLLRLFAECPPVGMDLVEVAHTHDPSRRTGIAAAWVLREAILTWWGK